MLDPNLLRNELDAVAEKLARRGFKLDVDTLRAQEERRKILQVETETLQAERNSRSKSIGAAKARGEDIDALRQEVNELGEKLLIVPVGVTVMANCFKLPAAVFGVSSKSSPFCFTLYLAQSLLSLRVININGVLPVAFFNQVAVTCSTNGL